MMYRQYQNPRWLEEAIKAEEARLQAACENMDIDEILWAHENLQELRDYCRFAWDDEEFEEMGG